MPDLKHYHHKRDPGSTPEPFGEDRDPQTLPPRAVRAFVVQQHAARNMHWDLRLEIEGVLVSWAVPRGPTLDPKEKRLAVQTEDHPMEYADFEGVIPDGNYGAGGMIVWDRGGYHSVDGQSPAEGLASGKLDLDFDGHKLRGRFALVRTRGEGGRQWLLLRKGDPPDADAPELIDAEPASVLSGLEVGEVDTRHDEELAAAADALGAVQRPVENDALRPMLATSSDAPFSADGWVFEVKYDGWRITAVKHPETGTQLFTRRGRDMTAMYAELARGVAHLPVDECVLDGEVVALDARGRSSFERLQQRHSVRDPRAFERGEIERPVVFFAFDLLSVAGRDVRALGLTQRKELLARLVPRTGYVRYADHVEREGEALFEAAREHELEGVIAKQADGRYESGRRSKGWVKWKVPRSAPLVIVGSTPGQGSRAALGSLVLAWYDGDSLVYAGNAGSGLDTTTLEYLVAELETLRVEEPAFALPEEPLPSGTRFVRPERVCQIRFTEVTGSGRLRHPIFEKLVDDRTPADCIAPANARTDSEPPVVVAPSKRETELRITRPEKIFWPADGYTKGDLLAYYEAIWPWLAPYLRDRPVVLTRYPDGIDGKNFFQKNAPDWTPDWVEREVVEGTDYFICNDLRTLLYVINSGAIPLHVWSARRTALDRPDWLILDLDPKEAPFSAVVRVARHIHALLDELDTPHFAKTSGQDGLHVMVPLGGALDHDAARTLGEVLARVVVADLADIATITRPVAARGDKVYVDYLQNGRGKLIASVFSVRPRPGAPISMPLEWSQVTNRLDPVRWNVESGPKRLSERNDPMLDLLDTQADVHALLDALVARLQS